MKVLDKIEFLVASFKCLNQERDKILETASKRGVVVSWGSYKLDLEKVNLWEEWKQNRD